MNLVALLTVLIGGASLLIPLCVGGLFIIVLAVVGVILYKKAQNTRTAQNVARSWPTAPGLILASDVKWQRGANNTTYQDAVVSYQYTVGGQTYQGNAIRAGEQIFKVSIPNQAQAIVARYPAGASVAVYYNPADPADAVLERGDGR